MLRPTCLCALLLPVTLVCFYRSDNSGSGMLFVLGEKKSVQENARSLLHRESRTLERPCPRRHTLTSRFLPAPRLFPATPTPCFLGSWRWLPRHIHIALDTLVLYSALGVTSDRSEGGGHFKAAAVSGRSASGAGNSDRSAAATAAAHNRPLGGGDGGGGAGDDVLATGDGHRRSRSAGYHVTRPAVELARARRWEDDGDGDDDSPPASNRYSYCRYTSTAIPMASVWELHK